MRVFSPPSTRVAALRPRFAGLKALTAAPRTLSRLTSVRRRNKHDPYMLWSITCSEWRVSHRSLTCIVGTCGDRVREG